MVMNLGQKIKKFEDQETDARFSAGDVMLERWPMSEQGIPNGMTKELTEYREKYGIGWKLTTLKIMRSTAAAYSHEERGHACFSTHSVLRTHEDRVALVNRVPIVTEREARNIMGLSVRKKMEIEGSALLLLRSSCSMARSAVKASRDEVVPAGKMDRFHYYLDQLRALADELEEINAGVAV